MTSRALALLALIPTAVLAQDVPAFAPEGLWLFNTYAQIEGRPVCSELWDFRRDGELLVESGQERVRKRFRVESDRDGLWIATTTLETNGRPDCMGAVSARPDGTERRTYVLPMNDGRVMTCPAPGHTRDGTPVTGECYGWLIPAADAG